MSAVAVEMPRSLARQSSAKLDIAWWPRSVMREDGFMTSSGQEAERLLRQLYDSHAGTLRAFVLRLNGGDWQRAEDVVQETLLRAWRNADNLLSEPARLRPWLVMVARRIVIDEHRGRVARPRETGPEPLEDLATADASESVVTAITVTRALRMLSEPHRRVLIETYFHDRNTHEAAQVLALPAGTVKSRVYYALRSLRQILIEQEVTS